MKLMKLSEYKKQCFADGSAPCDRTIIASIAAGETPGRKIGGLYYVDLDLIGITGNDLVDKVLNDNKSE